ncbi:hypothetical protein Q7M76_05465 (plasmid) [Candidatus Liberibacter asiaticus]
MSGGLNMTPTDNRPAFSFFRWLTQPQPTPQPPQPQPTPQPPQPPLDEGYSNTFRKRFFRFEDDRERDSDNGFEGDSRKKDIDFGLKDASPLSNELSSNDDYRDGSRFGVVSYPSRAARFVYPFYYQGGQMSRSCLERFISRFLEFIG